VRVPWGNLSRSLWRIAIGSAIAIPACAAVIGLLLFLPGWCALGTMFVGLVLFMVGAEVGIRWAAVVGGVLMFGGVSAAGVLGVLR